MTITGNGTRSGEVFIQAADVPTSFLRSHRESCTQRTSRSIATRDQVGAVVEDDVGTPFDDFGEDVS